MIILAAAERAKEVASILGKFREYDPDNTIPAAIAQLQDLSQVLRELARLIEAKDGLVSRIVADDLELLQHSVAYTLQDIWTIIGRLPGLAIGHDYCEAWKAIVIHCRNTRRQSLPMRLETYCVFAAAIRRHLRG
jgi:GAF domain-containing protein